MADDGNGASVLLWVTVGEAVVLGLLLVPLLLTVHRRYEQWLVFRSRGMFYTNAMTWGPFVQIVLSMAAVVLCVHGGLDRTSPVLMTLVMAEQVFLFAFAGVIIARQLILSQIFQTLPWQRADLVRPMSVNAVQVYLVVCAITAVIWVGLAAVPQALMAFGTIAVPVASATTLLASTILSLAYAVVVICNRHINISVFCDYHTNIVTFVMMVLVVVAASCINVIYYYPNNLWESNIAFRSAMYVFVAPMFAIIAFGRPVWAVWRHDLDYLAFFEDISSSPGKRGKASHELNSPSNGKTLLARFADDI